MEFKLNITRHSINILSFLIFLSKINFMKNILIPFIITCINPILAHAGDHTGTITSNSISRTFEYYTPNVGMAEDLALVIVYHGLGGNATHMKQISGFNTVAENEKFIVVYPNSTTIGGAKQWNAYIDNQPGHAGIPAPNATDDIKFTEDLIDYFCSNYGIDKNKVYATGLSNGGFMCYNLAVNLSNKIAAIAPIAANMWGDNTYVTNYFTNAFTKIPVLHLHGDADAVVAYPDADHNPATWDFPLASYSNATCASSTYTNTVLSTNVHKHTYCSSASGFEVSLIRFIGMAHIYPTTLEYNTPQEIWNFFKNYQLSVAGNNCIYVGPTSLNEEAENNKLQLFPNPVRIGDQIQITGLNSKQNELEVIDVYGKTVTRIILTENATFRLPNIESGIYFIKSGSQTIKLVLTN